jgi:hypothetical protein
MGIYIGLSDSIKIQLIDDARKDNRLLRHGEVSVEKNNDN